MSQNTKLTRYIKLIGFSDIEAAKFSAVLDLADFGLLHQWQLSNAPGYHVTVLNGAHSADSNAATQQACCLNYALFVDEWADNTIYHDGHYVTMLHSLIEQLNAVEAIAQLPQKTLSSYSPPAFLQALLTSKASHIIHLVPDKLYIDAEAKTFYYSKPLVQLHSHFYNDALPPPQQVNSHELAAVVNDEGLSAQPLSHLIWYATFTTSTGHLMPTLSVNDVIQLTDWPYLGASPYTQVLKLR